MARKLMSSEDIDKFGFEWPAVDAMQEPPYRASAIQVARVAAIQRSNGLYRMLEATTPNDQVTLYISPTGRIRIFTDGKEWSRGT